MAIHSTGLRFHYNEENRFSFPDIDLKANEQLLVLGGSGRGKTTFLHLLGGILPAMEGRIVIKDTDITRLSPKKMDHFRGSRIGMVFQKAYFVKSITVEDNLLLAQKLGGKRENKNQINELLQHLDIHIKIKSYPSELSVGEQQRLSIARAVINHPDLILADEPTSALDDLNADRVAGLLQNTAREQDANLIVVTHDRRLKDLFEKKIEL
jgi:ABC-type lipoprotein export system ATPase subunit